MRKRISKYVVTAIISCLVFILNLSPITSFALSNGKDFKNEGKNPLAVTVSYYTDALSRGVAWTTMTATDGVLEVVPAKSEAEADWSKAEVIDAQRKVEDSTYYTYTAHVENLTEDSYCYRVGSKDGSAYSKVGTFTVDHDQSEINFIYATDPQDYDEEGFSQWANLVDAAYKTMPEAQFFGLGGDVVNNSHDEDDHDLDQWIYAMQLPQENFMNSVLMPVAGNHDKLEETFCNRFAINYQGSRDRGGYYSFDYGNMHFVGLNTNESGDALAVQMEWLRNDLNNTDKQWKIVMMHKGPISTGDHSNDSDVAKIREAILPIMAECKVDVVLQGHDHVYVRSVPYYYGENEFGVAYSGQTPNLEETVITETVDGRSVTYSVEPNGTFYTTANYAGRKSYPPVEFNENLIHLATNPYNGLEMSQQIQLQMFTTVKISGNTLEFNAYTFDGENALLYDTYNIKKDTHLAVEEQIRALPQVADANIFDYEDVQRVNDSYHALVNNAARKMDGELKSKIEALSARLSVENCEEAYTVACAIRDLGDAVADKSFMDKIKLIKRQYADLNEEQAQFVTNYDEVAEKENDYKDLLYASAVSELANKCVAGEVSPIEVQIAYNALTDQQKTLVDLHGVSIDGVIGESPDANIQPGSNGCGGQIGFDGMFIVFVALCFAISVIIKKQRSEGKKK